MTEFAVQLRHRCRNPRCRANLPAPVANAREAFCCRGCYSSFHLHRCVVCEAPIERKTGNQKVCRRVACRNALKGGVGLGRYHTPQTAKLTQKVPDSIGLNQPINADRPAPIVVSRRSVLIRNARQAEFLGGGRWRGVVSPDGVVCSVTRLWGNEPQFKVCLQRLAA